ncbi:MAG TPA: diacylglycerol kinase family protein [Candidatus Paceibacterota bacterium]
MTRFYKSIKNALAGFKDAFTHENNFRFMVFIGGITLSLMFYFPTTITEKLIILIMIFSVLALELINSVIERIMDFIYQEHHKTIKEIKDVMAFIVLFVSLGAAIVGLIIFLPYIFY